MSIFLTDITLVLNTKSTISSAGYNLENTDWIELQNASPYACKVLIGNTQLLMPAWYDFPIPIALYSAGGKRRVLPGLGLPFSVTPYLQTIPGSGFTQTLHTIVYLNGEVPASTTPQPLGGSPINLAIATSVVNTGNPATTLIVTGQPSSDAGTNSFPTQISNNGQIILGDTNNPAPSIQLLGNPLGVSQWTSSLMELFTPFILANNQPLQWNDNASITQHTVLLVDNNNNVYLNALSGQSVNLQDGSGGIQGKLDTSGFQFPNNPINLGVAGTVLNGSTSGTATLWEPIIGTALKVVIVSYNNFRNGGGSTQISNFPTAFTTFQLILSSNIPAVALGASNAGVSVGQMIFSTVGGTGGTESSQATIVQNVVASHLGAADSLRHTSAQAAAWTGWLVIIGI